MLLRNRRSIRIAAMKALHASLAVGAVIALGAASFGVGYGVARNAPPRLQPAGAASDVRLDETTFSRKIDAATRSASVLEQSAAMAEILPGLQPDDFARLAPELEESFGIGSAALPGQLFVERWAQLEPEAAFERVAGWPADRRREVMPGLVRAWARSDPRAALSRLAELEDRSLRKASQRALVQGWAERDDTEIWGHVAGFGRSRARREMMIIVIQQVAAREGHAGLLAVVAAQTGATGDDTFRNEAMGLAADVLARADLALAVAEAEACPPAPWCDPLTAAVAVRWASLDGEPACTWTRGLPAGDAREGAMYAAYSTWLRRDGEPAARWLDAQEHVADLGRAFSARGRITAQRSIPEAVRWADQIESPEMRREAQIAVGRVYRRKDPAGAARWLDARGLSEAVPLRASRNAAAE
jgi:hypothetical protein